MLRRGRSALHRTREELIDPRLHWLRFQRLLQVRCRSHVYTPLAQLLLGNKHSSARVRVTRMRVAQAETERDHAKITTFCKNKTNNLLQDRPGVLAEDASHQREIVNGVMRLCSSNLPVVPDRIPSLLELLHLGCLDIQRYSVYRYTHTCTCTRARACTKIAN